ncbi:HEAT repeat domain-containing protein [Halohasta litorea]|uniref:HEAT repeat domain-containing protein n=1 Tax=Halohasta litorea TaxID=869891 RepID=A0ABD6D318_9EURY|nr:HEAT repeat domain-containing protein [Halohasta litorea]
MSNGDEEAETVDSLTERLEAVGEALEAAETEADLDEIEADLDAIESELDESELPVPDDEESPADELESQIEDYRNNLEAQRGPYAEDVTDDIEAAKPTIEDGEWTEQGEGEVVEAVAAFAETVGEILESPIDDAVTGLDSALDALSDSALAVTNADLDPDEDSETLESLVEAVDTLDADLDEAQEWSDLTVRETLRAEGYYDVLGHIKDYPPEWAALKEHEKRGNTEMVLLAYDLLDSDFMEEHCLDTLARMGPVAATDEAIDEMLQLAGKRDKTAIKILGKMGATEAVETLVEYVDADSDPTLQKVTFRALGEIGDEEAIQPLANKLLMDNDNVRPQAARALGLLGDTRAIKPLSETLKADEDSNVRAQAAWALRQIGTKRALEAVVDHGSDETFIVQTEIDKARRALDATVPNA